jgi:hypothetical protein
VTDFDVKAEYKRENRKVTAVKFRVRRVEQFPGQRPRQGELFLDDNDTPLAVRELKSAGLAADEAWKIWQEGFNSTFAAESHAFVPFTRAKAR